MVPVLPFTAEVLESLVGRYMTAIWPLPAVAPVLAVITVALAVRPVRGGGLIVAGLLAAAWAGVGIDFHIRTAASIDFLAPIYGAFFLVQAALLAWTGIVRGRMPFGFGHGAAGWTGLALAAFAVAGYPLLALLTGRTWPSLPVVGVTPDPTVMLTLGVLLLTGGRIRLHLLAVPVLWSLVAALTALSLGTPERLVLPAAAAVTVALALWTRRSRATAQTRSRPDGII